MLDMMPDASTILLSSPLFVYSLSAIIIAIAVIITIKYINKTKEEEKSDKNENIENKNN
jgi:large-conductance mechanosensitive channel